MRGDLVAFLDSNMLVYAILEAARQAGCSRVLSEDLSAGRDYGGITVENPFT